ncbi:MAG: ATP-binding protein [Candidatus Pacebacteria bacterium]|nr:ATP-binding protein [Candidatus Paceibacterota bacterium]MDD2757469.1 ATP-binding protein [Candidatus Paceibacterota bacterium]MDD3970077.1 ATP-binding protein [Candidatus Paceibacterota bacterium]
MKLLLRAKIELEANVSIEVESVKINTNGLFYFVISNLIDNSIRHGEKKEIKIRVSSEIEGKCLLIIYEDNGIGILQKDKQRIFFHGFGKHTGLGMFFTKQILEMMGSTIVENGVPGKGARFEIRIPEDIYKMSDGDL